MSKKFQSLLVIVALLGATLSAYATGATVASTPEGMITFNLTHGSVTYLSLPLTTDTTYTSSVTAVTTTTISVGDSPAPFTTSLSTPSAPYFVKFLSGNEMGRVLLITGNTTSALTLDTTDHNTGSPDFLNTSGFDVEVGDTFEIFPGDTLASVFGAATAQSPLLLTGGTSSVMSDTLCLFTTTSSLVVSYYFNTTAGCWEQIGSTVNANNTIIYPYSALAIARRKSHGDTSLVLGGRVSSVPVDTKVVGNGTIFSSTHLAADVTLSQLQLGSNWVTGTSAVNADTLGVWNAELNHFDTYYQTPNSTWRKFPDATTDQSNFAITAGSVMTITKRESVIGASAFVQAPLPYSLD